MRSLRFIFLSIFGSICFYSQAQTSELDYRPFAQDGKKWETQVGGIKENLYVYSIEGDTIIDGETWKKVYNYRTFHFSYFAAIRDVGNKVYAIANGSDRPRLLYDFDLKEGSTVKCGVEGNAFGCLNNKAEQADFMLGFPFDLFLKVERIDTIIDHEMEYRRFILTPLDAYMEYFMNGEEIITGNIIWIEGIGSVAGPFSPWMPIPPRRSLHQSCEVNNVCIYGYPYFDEADTPADVSSTESQNVQSSEISGLYDSSGRRLSTPPAKGVYIENGRKKLNIEH